MPKAPVAYEEAAETPRGEVDQDALEELYLFIENTSELYQQKKSILSNLDKKIASGKYDPALASKLWGYWVDAGAKQYAKEFGGRWNELFNKATREALAERIARQEHTELLLQRGSAREPQTSVELVEMQMLLEKHGFDPKYAAALQKEGIGTYELEHRLRYGDLSHTHGLKRRPPPRRAAEAVGDPSAMSEDCVGVHTHTPVKADVAVIAAEAAEESPTFLSKRERHQIEQAAFKATHKDYRARMGDHLMVMASPGRTLFLDKTSDAELVKYARSVGAYKPAEEKHEARDVVPSGEQTFATLRRDAPPQDVVKQWGTLDGPRKIYDIAKSLQTETGECFVVIGIDVQGQVIPCDGKPGVLIAKGQMDRVSVEPDDVAQAIAVMKPAGYVLVHQHPSGRATPSKADKDLTASIRRTVTTSAYVDHVVIGANEYHSMRDGKTYKA